MRNSPWTGSGYRLESPRTRSSHCGSMNHMEHPIHRVTAFELVEPFVLDVSFDDATRQRIDFRPVLHGELYRPLRDAALFERVEIDPEVHTLVWPNGADFDPATLHDWPHAGPLMVALAQRWAAASSRIDRSGFPSRIIGIDYSTEDKKIGLALAVRDEDDYPLQKATVCDRRRPASSIVEDWLNESSEAALLAIDAPLGWPLPLASALISHTAGTRIDTSRDRMFRRETEVFIHRETRQKPLDVGADKIARTAHAALHFLGTLGTRLGTAIPLAWDPATVIEHAAIEVYPAATLKVHGIRPTGKTNQQRRCEIADALQAKLTVPKHIGNLARNEHLLDAAVCVLAAMDFITGRAMPPPDRCRAEQEGWIWTAKPG